MTETVTDDMDFFTMQQLARRWQVSSRTIMREIAIGELVTHKFNKSVRIALDDVLAYEAKRRRKKR